MKYNDPYRHLNEQEFKQTWNRIQASISYAQDKVPTPYARKSIFKAKFFAKEYIAALLMVFLLSSTTSLAAAADNSLPTSVLYGIKINVTEPLRGLTKTTPQAKISWEIERTSRRLEETKQLIETKTLTPEIATSLSKNIESHTSKAQSEITELSESNSQESTILSLALVETIEKKKEDITIAVESITKEADTQLLEDSATEEISPVQLSAPVNQNESVEPSQSEKKVSPDTATQKASKLEVSEANKKLIETTITPSVSSILSVADNAQTKTNTLITAIKTEQKEKTTTNSNEPKEQTEQELNVVTYTLILKDIQTQLTTIKNSIGIKDEIIPKENADEQAEVETKEETSDKTETESTEVNETDDESITKDTSLQSVTDANDASATITKDSESKVPTTIESTQTVSTKISTPTTETKPVVTESDKSFTETKSVQQTITKVVTTTKEVVKEISDTNKTTVTTTPVTEPNQLANATTEPTVKTQTEINYERYQKLSADFEALKKIKEPKEADIVRARDVRKRAQNFIQELTPKAEEKKPEVIKPLPAENTTNKIEIIPEIKIEEVTLPVVETEKKEATKANTVSAETLVPVDKTVSEIKDTADTTHTSQQ